MNPESRTKQQLMRELDNLYQQLEDLTPSTLGLFTAQELLLNASTTVRKIFDLANVFILGSDPTGSIILINKRGCLILEGTEEQILHSNWFSTFLPEEDQDRIRDFFKDLIQGRVELASTNVNRIRTLTGREKIIAWSNKVLKADDGAIVAIVSSGEDVTDRQKQQEELRRSEEKHRILVEASTDAIFIETVDGEILDCNRRACEMFGYKKTELLSRTIYDLIRPEFAPLIPDIISKQLRNGGMFIEAENRRKDGSYFPVEVSTKLLSIGGIPSLIVYIRDITERKKHQVLLQAQASRLAVLREIDRCILNDQPPSQVAALAVGCLHNLLSCEWVGILEYDAELERLNLLATNSTENFQLIPDTSLSREQWLNFKTDLECKGLYGFTSVNDLSAALPGLVIEEPVSKSVVAVSALLVKDDLVGVLIVLSPVVNEDVQIITEISNQVAIAIHQARLTAKNYEHLNFLELKVSARTSELRKRITLTEKLITRIKKKNSQLEMTMDRLSKANDELEAFSYSISHDLRAHVRRVDYYSNLLLDEGKNHLTKDELEYLSRTLSETALMDLMIKDVLDYSRMTRSSDKLVPVNLAACLMSAIKTLETEILRTKAQLQLPETFPPVLGQATLLTNIIGNVLSNALKFLRPGIPPLIRIDLEDHHEHHCLWIEDNGIGIDPDAHARVFELFERLNSDETYPGTGVGLAIVKRGMQRLQGDVLLESQPGSGSRFGLLLKKIS